MIWCLLLGLAALAAPRIQLQATVHDNLQTISGSLTVIDGHDLRLADMLSLLPEPPDDLTAHRTWPASPEQGRVQISPADRSGAQAFYSILPRRYGASGFVPGRGLFVNGLWHPQPMDGPSLQPVTWEVTLTLPAGAVGVLNGVTGSGTLHWSGQSERLSLAVIPDGELRDVPLPRGTLTVVDSRRRSTLDDRLAAVLQESWPAQQTPQAVVVVTPSRRRLSRPGAGVLYLSDRAFRLSGRLWSFHTQAVRLGLLQSLLPIPDAQHRHLAAGALVHAQPEPPDVEEALGLWSWIPQVDALLYSGQMPFFSETFDEPWPSDPLADDLQELVDRWVPGRIVAARIDAVYGDGTALRIAQALLAGSPPHSATIAAGVPPAALRLWSIWPLEQDYSLQVSHFDHKWQVLIQRDAPESAAEEPVTVLIDGIQREFVMGPGSDVTSIEQRDRPRSVQIDPDAALLQESRSNDRWPARWTTVAYLSPAFVQDRIVGSANLGFRKQYNTRWRYSLSLSRSNRTQVGVDVGAVRSIGPLLDRRYRPLRLWLGAGGSVLNPDFRPTDDGGTALELYTGISHDTRFAGNQARSGHRLSLSAGGGLIPESEERWLSSQLTVLGLLPATGRLTIAGQLRAGLATGQVEHRLLSLGGDGAVKGLPYDSAVGNWRVLAAPELRWTIIKHASVPLPLMWASDLQLNLGADAGIIHQPAQASPTSALGWSLGAGATADILGADPSYGSIGVAGPIATSDGGTFSLRLEDLQLYVRISQTF